MIPALGNQIRGLTRRELLLRGMLATGGLIVAGVFVRAGMFVGEGAAVGRRVLSAREEKITRAMIEAALPGSDDMPPGDVAFMLHHVDEYLAGTSSDVRLLFKAIVQLVEEQSIATYGARFTSLSIADRQAELHAWERTPLWLKRSAFQTVKLILGMAYFEQPEATLAIGWYVGCAPPHLLHKSKDRLLKGTS